MEAAGFTHLSVAPKDILGVSLIAGHWSGATEAVTYDDKDQAAEAYRRGWVWFKLKSNER